MEIVIRAGVASDAPGLAELAARTFRDTFGPDNRPEDIALHVAENYGAARQLRELTDADYTTLLVEIGGQLAGYAQVRSGHTPECVLGEAPLELFRFYIAPPWHGRGVAGDLMRRVVAEASRRGGRTLWLGVWERNRRAMAFYRKHQFRDVGAHVFIVGTDPQTDRIFVRPVVEPAPPATP